MSVLQMKLKEETKRSRPVMGVVTLVIGMVALFFSVGLSISYGAADIQLHTVWQAIFTYDQTLTTHQIIHDIRFPRVLGAAIVGACFAVAGALIQGITRNPLGDPGLLGLSAGAAFMLAICFAFFPGMKYIYLVLFSFLGASIGAGMVYGVGSLARGGLTPMRLVLAGAAVTALLTALSEGIAIYFNIGQELAFWSAGGVSGTTWFNLKILTPFVFAGFLGAILLSKSITLLSLGDEIAVGLGQKTGVIKFFGAIIVLVLAGAAVSIVGAVGFVGLMVPHITRFIVGHDYRWIIPVSIVLGALFVVLADLGARVINPPHETPIGALIALIGVPFFLYLSRKGGKTI